MKSVRLLLGALRGPTSALCPILLKGAASFWCNQKSRERERFAETTAKVKGKLVCRVLEKSTVLECRCYVRFPRERVPFPLLLDNARVRIFARLDVENVCTRESRDASSLSNILAVTCATDNEMSRMTFLARSLWSSPRFYHA